MKRLEGTPREVAGFAAALLVAVASAIAITWPMAANIDQVVLGGGELGGWLWRYNWHYMSLDGLMQTNLGPIATWVEFVGLGRYPETGNVLDVLAISYPLEKLFGFPTSYNVKVLLILSLNGLAGYGLARYFSGSVSASIAASALAVVNPLCIQEVQACGLRQAILWWVLLYPAVLDRALRRRTLGAGVVAGAVFGLAGAYYWFYGLFTLIFSAVWFFKHILAERSRVNATGVLRATAGAFLGTVVLAGAFVLPYAMPGAGGSKGGASALPEMTFFLPYPPYDTVSTAPLRPQTYAENLLASIHRTIGSTWSATYPFDPSLNESLQWTVLVLGLLPALLRSRSWGWLGVWLFFYVGTLGPFLRIGTGDAQEVTRFGADHDMVLRLPYTLMFQYIPGMSRMFAPYRLGSYVIVASVVLLATGLARTRFRAWIAPLVIAATVMQPMGRWGRGAVNEGDADSRWFRSPLKINRIIVPDYYKQIDATALSGIIELPFDQQQDLLYLYQIVHGQRVYRSWASPAAVPPALRAQNVGGEYGARLRYQARKDAISGPVPDALAALSRDVQDADLSTLTLDSLQAFSKTNNYRRIILHERGYYLVDPKRGGLLYDTARRRLGEAIGLESTEYDELTRGDPKHPQLGVPIVGDLVPWSSQPMDLPPEKAPAVYHMAVWELPDPGADLSDMDVAPGMGVSGQPGSGRTPEAQQPEEGAQPPQPAGDGSGTPTMGSGEWNPAPP